MTLAALDTLAELHGLSDAYYNYKGELQYFSATAKCAILSALGYAVEDPHALAISAQAAQHEQDAELLPPVCLCTRGQPMHCVLSLPDLALDTPLQWVVQCEQGEVFSGRVTLRALTRMDASVANDITMVQWQCALPDILPLGYHQLTVTVDVGLMATTHLIVTPNRCYEPATLSAGQRSWGLSVQLYTLRSEHNWGMGDFADLVELITLAAPLGCALVGVNPLHALRPADPTHISPYSPSSRQFMNVLYVAVPLVAEFSDCAAAQAYLQRADTQADITRLRASEKVDYVGVARLKLTALRFLYAHFCQHHLAAGSARAAQFQRFVQTRGQDLALHALYDALDEYFTQTSKSSWGWRSWPAAYHDPRSPAVLQFQREQQQQIEFYMYLQWLATEQLAAVQAVARTQGMHIGVYGDVAVGVDPNGADSWANQTLYLGTASIGAPPDLLALTGQDWGIPPQNPMTLRTRAYQPFIDMVRSNMQQVGALRIDHVMSLCRLWWVPRGHTAAEGMYVRYPLNALMGIVALESLRHHCLVIGEDLGTVPEEMRIAMEQYGVYHYKVLLFEKDAQGQFYRPGHYVRTALATVTTHDLPPLKSWWEGHDIRLREQLHLYPDQAIVMRVQQERQQERHAMMQALVASGLWYWQPHEPLPTYSFALLRAISLYLGRTTAALMTVQLEDLLCMVEPVNVPGTHTEHANWQRKLTHTTQHIFALPEVQEMLQTLSQVRSNAAG